MTAPHNEAGEIDERHETPDGDHAEPTQGQGPLLDEPDVAKVARAIIAKTDAQKKAKARLGAVVRRNKAWGRGVRGVKIVEETDRDEFKVTAPVGAKNASPVPNKVAALIEKTVAVLTADRPVPDVPPSSGDDDDVNAAAFATRLLIAAGGESGNNDTALARWALTVAGYTRSAFVYLNIDPTGGGRHPVEVHCHPNAEAYDHANPAACMNDPMTGQPIADELAVIKYLHPDGSLKKAKSGAQMRWVNKVVPEVVTSETVWLHPPTCRGIHDADEVTVGRVITLGQAKAQFEKLAQMDDGQLEKLVRWRPSTNARGWLSSSVDDASKTTAETGATLKDADGKLSDDNLIFGFHHYILQSETYPRGAYVCVMGGSEVPQRSPWSVTVGDGDDAEDIALDLPLAQFRWKDDPVDRDPMGISGAEQLGSMDEVRAAQMMAALEWLYRFNRPIQYLPAGSPLQGKNVAQARENQTFVAVNMDGSGRPISEEVPPLPPLVLQIYEGLSNEMDEAAGVPKSLQGLTQNGVNSGLMQNQQIEQALQTLAPIFQNTEDGLCRMWRVSMQLMRGFYDVPRLAKLGSEGGGYELKAWSGADLKGATDVQIQRGTFTALTSSVKRSMASEELQLALATKDPSIITEAWQHYQDATRLGLSAKLGSEDDPAESRVKRQIAAWSKGPSDALTAQSQQWQAQQAPQQAAMQQATAAAQQLGQQPPPPPQPAPDPMAAAASALFTPILSDTFPQVSKVRLRHLTNAQQQRRYETAAPAWRAALDQALMAAKGGSGMMTAPEQQQSAQQAAQQKAQLDAQRSGQIASTKAQADTQKNVTTVQAQGQVDEQVQRANDQRDTAHTLLKHALHKDATQHASELGQLANVSAGGLDAQGEQGPQPTPPPPQSDGGMPQ